MVTSNAINADSTGLVRYNGTGTFDAVTVTQHDVLIGAASNGITSLALTNGQLAIGSTGADPVAAGLTAGTGVTITPAAGSITIAATGSVPISFVTNSGTATPSANTLNVLATTTAAGTTPAATTGSGNTVTVDVQTSQAIAATDATKIGLSAFDSAKFTVDANGFVSTSGTGIAQTITGNTGGALSPTAGNWNIVTANATPIFAGSGSTETLDFAPSNNFNLVLGSSLPSASGFLNVGMGYQVLNAMTSGGANSIFGHQAGNNLTTGTQNVAVGNLAFQGVVTSSNNTMVGYQSGRFITSGGTNSGFGEASLVQLTTGTNNIAVGSIAGFNYASSESSNIVIGNQGTVAESNVIRIGTQGSSAGQQNTAFMAGIIGVTNSNPVLTTINSSTGQLGVQALTQFDLVSGGASNAVNLIAPSATSGVPLISQGASAQPIYGTAVVAGGGTGLATLTAHALQVGNGTGTVTQLGVGATGTVLTGVTGADPAFSATPTVTSISFGGTALGNYVQGTWTPALAFGGSSTGITYATQTGTYTRIGNVVFIAFQISLSSKGSATGNATITGLPVTTGSTATIAFNLAHFDNGTFTGTPYCLINGSSTTMQLLFSLTGSDVTAITNTNVANNSKFGGEGFYLIA